MFYFNHGSSCLTVVAFGFAVASGLANELRVYVDGPSGAQAAPGVTGHVFLQLLPSGGSQAGQSNLVFGNYPAGPNLYRGFAEIRNDAGRRWDWRITYPVGLAGYNAAARAINPDISTGLGFHLHRANAGDWVAEIAAAAGVELPPFTNRLGIHDPNALRVSLAQIGDGKGFAGGVVTSNATGRAADGGSVDTPPRDVSFDGIVAQTKTRQAAHQLAVTLGLPFQVRGLSTAFVGLNQVLLVQVTGAEVSDAVIAMNWGDGTSTNQSPVLARTYRRTGIFNASVVVVDQAAVMFFEFGVSVQTVGGPHVVSVAVPSGHPASGTNPGFEYPWWAAVQAGSDAPLGLVQALQPAMAAEGERVVLRVGVTGPDAAYQWFRDGVQLSRETVSMLVLDPVRPADAGSYTMRATNAFPSVLVSGPVEVKVMPDVTAPRVSGAVAVDATELVVVYSEAMGASAAVAGNYVIPGGVPVLSATLLDPRRVRLTTGPRPGGADSIEISNVTDRSAAANSISPNPTAVGLVPATPPTVDVPPQSVEVPAGGLATFSVTATSLLPMRYQWQRGGTNIPGAQQPVMEVYNAQVANAGDYAVVVSNRAGSALSTGAVLTVVNGSPWFQINDPARVHAGETLVLPVGARDPDRPAQSLEFALLAGPVGATLDAASGRLNWPVPWSEPPGPAGFRVRVTDDGSPAAAAETNLTVNVAAPISVAISRSGSAVTLGWNTLPGRTYQAWFAGDLSESWQLLGDPVTASGDRLEVSDTVTDSTLARFYRVTVLPVCVVEGSLTRSVVYSRGNSDAVELTAQRALSDGGSAIYETARVVADVALQPACPCDGGVVPGGDIPIRLRLTVTEADKCLETALASFLLMAGEAADPGTVELPDSPPRPHLATVTAPLTYRQAHSFVAEPGTGSWTATATSEVPCTSGLYVRRFVLSSLLAGETETPGWHGPHLGLTAYVDVAIRVEHLADGSRRIGLDVWYLDFVPGFAWETRDPVVAEAANSLPELDYVVWALDSTAAPSRGTTRNLGKLIEEDGRVVDRAFPKKLVKDTDPRR